MIQKLKYAKINWSPFATNVLDAGEFDLCTPDGYPIDLHRDGMRFVLIVGKSRLETDDNLKMSYWLNQYEIGGRRKETPSNTAFSGHVVSFLET